MKDILLTSEDFIKSVTNISDNLSDKYLLGSMREAQDQGLRRIIGDCLFSHLKDLVGDGSINAEANAKYKELLEECKYYLAYKTIVEVTNKVAYKIANAGVVKTTDDNVQAASPDEISHMQYYYQSKADSYCYDLQRWILARKELYPELDACQCDAMRANLVSHASCGIFLGGARGRQRKGRCGR